MSLSKILEVIISDVLIAGIISGLSYFIANRHAKENEKNAEKNLQDLKDHLDLRLEVIENELKTFIADRK